MNSINRVFASKAHVFMIYTSFCFWIIIIMLMSGCYTNARHSSPSLGPDRQVSVSGLMRPLSANQRPGGWLSDQSEARTELTMTRMLVMSGVMRSEAVTRSNVNWNTNTALNCLSERRRHKTVVRWGKLRGGDGEGGPAAVNTGRNIQLSVKFIPLVQDCSCGVTHTQRLLGSLFVHSEHFAKLDRN